MIKKERERERQHYTEGAREIELETEEENREREWIADRQTRDMMGCKVSHSNGLGLQTINPS